MPALIAGDRGGCSMLVMPAWRCDVGKELSLPLYIRLRWSPAAPSDVPPLIQYPGCASICRQAVTIANYGQRSFFLLCPDCQSGQAQGHGEIGYGNGANHVRFSLHLHLFPLAQGEIRLNPENAASFGQKGRGNSFHLTLLKSSTPSAPRNSLTKWPN